MPTVAVPWRQGVDAFRPSACRITMKDVWFRQRRLQPPVVCRARNYGYLNIDAASDRGGWELRLVSANVIRYKDAVERWSIVRPRRPMTSRVITVLDWVATYRDVPTREPDPLPLLCGIGEMTR